MTETLEKVGDLLPEWILEESEVQEGTGCVVGFPGQCPSAAAFRVYGLPFCPEHGEECLAGLVKVLQIDAKEALEEAWSRARVYELYGESIWEDTERLKAAAGLTTVWETLGLDRREAYPLQHEYTLVCELMFAAYNQLCDGAVLALEPLREKLAANLKDYFSDQQ